jgi:hypothetical protein
MIQISREDFEKLRKAKLIRNGVNKNYHIFNKDKRGSRKKYYIVEEKAILDFLGLTPEY